VTAAPRRGAGVVYQTLNPPYHEWTTQFPLLRSGMLAAAEATPLEDALDETLRSYRDG
jgi:hypothetical protein